MWIFAQQQSAGMLAAPITEQPNHWTSCRDRTANKFLQVSFMPLRHALSRDRALVGNRKQLSSRSRTERGGAVVRQEPPASGRSLIHQTISIESYWIAPSPSCTSRSWRWLPGIQLKSFSPSLKHIEALHPTIPVIRDRRNKVGWGGLPFTCIHHIHRSRLKETILIIRCAGETRSRRREVACQSSHLHLLALQPPTCLTIHPHPTSSSPASSPALTCAPPCSHLSHYPPSLYITIHWNAHFSSCSKPATKETHGSEEANPLKILNHRLVSLFRALQLYL